MAQRITKRVTSENTKRMFADALKGTLRKKCLSQITVKELVASCGVNHKTFYYHFRDIYDLVHWMLDCETESLRHGLDATNGYEDIVRYLIDYIRANGYMLNCLCNAIGKQEFYAFIHEDLSDIVRRLVLTETERQGVDPEDPYIAFLCDFLAKALSGMLLDYLVVGTTETGEEELVHYVVYTFRTTVETLLARLTELPRDAEGTDRKKGGASPGKPGTSR